MTKLLSKRENALLAYFIDNYNTAGTNKNVDTYIKQETAIE